MKIITLIASSISVTLALLHTHTVTIFPSNRSLSLTQFSAFNFLMDHFDNLVAPIPFPLLPILFHTSGHELLEMDAVDLHLVPHYPTL